MTDRRPLSSLDERVFTLSDIRKLFAKGRKKLHRVLIIGGLCGLGIAMLKAPKYEVIGSFKEGKDSPRSETVSLKQLVTGANGDAETGQTEILMQSNQVLKPLVMRFGLQAKVPDGGILAKVVRRLSNLLKAECGELLGELDGFVFRDVEHEGMQTLSYRLRFEDSKHFAVFDGVNQVSLGTVQERVSLPDVAFIIDKVPKKLQLGRMYPLQICPWPLAVRSVRGNLEISANKVSKSIYMLKLQTSDRYQGVELLNGLMQEYRSYLKREHDALAKDQLAYLEHRQEEICEKLSSTFDDHTAYLQKNLSHHGSLSLSQKVHSISELHRCLSEKIAAIDWEYERLALIESEKHCSLLHEETPVAKELHKIGVSIQDLREQKDLIELCQGTLRETREMALRYPARIEELKQIQKNRQSAQKSLHAIEEGELLLSADWSFLGPLAEWASRISQIQTPEKRGDLIAYLDNHIRLLSMQEHIAQERIFYEEPLLPEFEGINLATVNALFVEYNRLLDAHTATIAHFGKLIEEILKSDFNISSLGAVLQDPLSCTLIARASEVFVSLRDEKHRSEKEEARWTQELQLHKQILCDHLKQLCEVEKLQERLIRDKLKGLQQASLVCINGQISALRERMGDLVRDRKSSLLEEKAILEKKQQELRSCFGDLPEQWRQEKWMHFKTNTGMKMISSITELVESKTISRHLHHIESKIVDPAILPEAPLKPKLFLFSFLGAFLATGGFFLRQLILAILRGFPISAESLQAMRYPFLGKISSFCDGPKALLEGLDLESLRQIIRFVDVSPKAQVVGLIAGKGPDYSYAIGELLSKIGRSSLVVRCDFNASFQDKDLPGLLQLWKGEIQEIPIRKSTGCDVITSGGFSCFGTEILQSAVFSQMIEACKKRYEYILLLVRSELEFSESVTPLAACDKAIVTAREESKEQLTPFIDWAYHEGKCRLAFIHTPG